MYQSLFSGKKKSTDYILLALRTTSGAVIFGATRKASPHMNCVVMPKVLASLGKSYHIGLMIGSAVLVVIWNVVYK